QRRQRGLCGQRRRAILPALGADRSRPAVPDAAALRAAPDQSMIDTLFFDLDGTLTDNYAGISACIVHALSRFGTDAPDVPALRACVGPSLRTSFARLLATDDPARIEQAIGHYRERFEVSGWQENVPY